VVAAQSGAAQRGALGFLSQIGRQSRWAERSGRASGRLGASVERGASGDCDDDDGLFWLRDDFVWAMRSGRSRYTDFEAGAERPTSGSADGRAARRRAQRELETTGFGEDDEGWRWVWLEQASPAVCLLVCFRVTVTV